MRAFLVVPLLLGLTACGGSSTVPTGATAPAKKLLAVGDPAPPLAVDLWLNGPEVKLFEPGTVYVLDFWATWCQPCLESMPHLAELQQEYKSQGLVVVPLTTVTSINPVERIGDFVAKRGPKLGLSFAVARSGDADRAYLSASGSDGLPTSFVIDRQGTIAYIGHPMLLDDVLPRVLAGTWRGAADVAALEQMRLDLGRAFDRAEEKPADGPTLLADFAKKYPEKARQPDFRAGQIVVLIRAKQFDEAKKLTEALIPELVAKKQAGQLNNLRSAWGDRQVNPEKKHIGLAVRAAEGVLAVEGESDPLARLALADAHHTAGDRAKAVEHAEKAQALAGDDENLKAFIAKQLAKYREAGKK
jgi:thiol-disulfide isomerase/thioredoxin